MTENKDNFNCWYSRILEDLYKDAHAGFVILMIVFPLLERYLREKSGIHEQKDLGRNFYRELRKIFPVLKGQYAQKFWKIYRHGLLHQAAFKSSNCNSNKKKRISRAWLTSEVDTIEITESKDFFVNPINFAKAVIKTIESDFFTFEGYGSTKYAFPIEASIPKLLEERPLTVSGTHGTSGDYS